MSVTLTVGNSFSKITGLKDQDFQVLRKLLSYKVDYATAQFIPNPANHVKYCIDKTGNFASGLLPRVLEFLGDKKYDVTLPEVKAPKKYTNRGFKASMKLEPYKDQEKALKAVVKNMRGCISMATGSGKSFVIAMLLAKLKMKTLIIVPTIELKNQLTASLKDQLNSLDGVTIENIDSTSLETATDYDCLVLDEAHRAAAKTYHRLNKRAWNNISYRYSLTATPFRNDSEETLLYESIAGQVIYTLTYQDAVKAGYVVPVEAYYIDLPKQFVEGYTYQEIYQELIVNNNERNYIIAQFMAGLQETDKYGLCLVKEIEHGKKIADLAKVSFANGADEDSRVHLRDFSSGRINTLIATEGIAGEGVDTRPCEYVLIAGLGKAKSAFMQKVGRSVRRYPGKETAKVILFRDRSHRFCLRHYREQCKILKEEYGVLPVRLD